MNSKTTSQKNIIYLAKIDTRDVTTHQIYIDTSKCNASNPIPKTSSQKSIYSLPKKIDIGLHNRVTANLVYIRRGGENLTLSDGKTACSLKCYGRFVI